MRAQNTHARVCTHMHTHVPLQIITYTALESEFVGIVWRDGMHRTKSMCQVNGLININRVFNKSGNVTLQPLLPHNNCLDTDHKF